MSKLELHELPAHVLEKAQVIGNILDDLEKSNRKLTAIDSITGSDWSYSVTDEKVDLHETTADKTVYREFTQKEAQEMSEALGQIYMIAHTIHCEACDSRWRSKDKS